MRQPQRLMRGLIIATAIFAAGALTVLATAIANARVFAPAQRTHDTSGAPAAPHHGIFELAQAEQKGVTAAEAPPDRRGEAAALIETAKTLLRLGDTTGAFTAADNARQLAQEQLAAAPGDTAWQHYLAEADYRLGDAQRAQGKLSDALASHQAGLAAAQRLVAAEPDKPRWHVDVAQGYDKIGFVQLQQGKLPEALASFQASLAITQRLAAADPGSAARQHDLALSQDQIGDVLARQGNLPDALKSYQASFAIRERLVAADPKVERGNLAVSYGRIGNVQLAQSNRAEALKSYQAGHAILESLVASDPDNRGWQRALSEVDIKIGDVQQKQGNRAEALRSYQAALVIRERLATAAPDNALSQTDLAVSLWSVAVVSTPSDARAAFTRALTLLDPLARDGKLTSAQQNWPQLIRDRLAKLPP
jgi:tetratricopeptide (TPR) repeat protein